MSMIRVDFLAGKEQLDKLRKLAKQTGLAVSELIRRAIDEYLERKS